MQIHITRGEESSGPYTLEQVQGYLAQGILLPDDLAWHEGLENWVPLAQLVAEAGTPQPPEAVPAPPQPQEAIPAPVQPQEAIPAPVQPPEAVPALVQPQEAIPAPVQPQEAIPAPVQPPEAIPVVAQLVQPAEPISPQPQPAEPDSPQPMDPAPKPNRKKLMVGIAVGLLVLGGGGAATWIFFFKDKPQENVEVKPPVNPKPPTKPKTDTNDTKPLPPDPNTLIPGLPGGDTNSVPTNPSPTNSIPTTPDTNATTPVNPIPTPPDTNATVPVNPTPTTPDTNATEPLLPPVPGTNPEPTTPDANGTEQKQKALRDSVVGEYEFKKDGDTTKFIFLENGIQEWHKNGKKLKEYKWSIVNGQIRVDYHPDAFWVFRINTDKSITLIANVNHEHKLHQDYPKNLQQTFKKIK